MNILSTFRVSLITFALCFNTNSGAKAQPLPKPLSFTLHCKISTKLKYPNTPLDPLINFSTYIKSRHKSAVLNPASIRVFNASTKEQIPHTLSPEFNYEDKGRIRWVAATPQSTEYKIEFQAVNKRPPQPLTTSTPRIGTGELLRYNASSPRPVNTFYAAALVDLNGDGNSDLAGCWNYPYAPDETWNGIICYPRYVTKNSGDSEILVGDRIQIRHHPTDAPNQFHFFTETYQSCDFADLNKDGLIDLVQSDHRSKQARFFLNTGKQEPTGLPIYSSSLSVPTSSWEACRLVDLDQNGTLDLVVNGEFTPNINPEGWPFKAGKSIQLDAGTQPCFLDLNNDQLLDVISMVPLDKKRPSGYRLVWRANLGKNQSPTFGPAVPLTDITSPNITYVAATNDGPTPGLLVQYDIYQKLAFYPLTLKQNKPQFGPPKPIVSPTAVLSLSDQAWPYFCDWDNDHDLDLLVGGGYGWPRIVINEGTNTHPKYAEPQYIFSEDKPIRFLRNDLLGGPESGHNMGYHYPNFIDWNNDQLPDLIFPNETNRLFWFPNIGTKSHPKFGARKQILVDGFPDSFDARKRSAERAAAKGKNGVYPLEPERPFYWRTGAAFADWNNDGLTDFITLSSEKREGILFTQYKNESGQLRVKQTKKLKLADGRVLDDRIVNRKAHWTESFRPIDWNQDGKLDLLYSLSGGHNGIQDSGSMYILLNVGTPEEPLFDSPQTLSCFGSPIRITNHGPHPWIGDLNDDNLPDLIPCVEWSTYSFYSHAALKMDTRPEVTVERIGKD